MSVDSERATGARKALRTCQLPAKQAKIGMKTKTGMKSRWRKRRGRDGAMARQ
jgi:hypothetical protein